MPAVHRAEIAHPLVPDIPFSCVTENVANSNHGNGFIMVSGEYSEAIVKVTPAARTSG